MELLLIRHAIAAPAEAGQSDEERPLTAKGIERFGEVVKGLEALGLGIDRLRTSPLRRAVETADLLAPLLDGERESTELLARPPGEALLHLADGQCEAWVGHEPWMSVTLAWLLTGGRDAADQLQFKKGGVAWLEGAPEPGRMLLRAFLPPRVVRQLR